MGQGQAHQQNVPKLLGAATRPEGERIVSPLIPSAALNFQTHCSYFVEHRPTEAEHRA